MLKEAQVTRGIGVGIARSTQCISTKDALIDRVLTFAANAKQKKTTKTAQHEDLASRNRFRD